MTSKQKKGDALTANWDSKLRPALLKAASTYMQELWDGMATREEMKLMESVHKTIGGFAVTEKTTVEALLKKLKKQDVVAMRALEVAGFEEFASRLEHMTSAETSAEATVVDEDSSKKKPAELKIEKNATMFAAQHMMLVRSALIIIDLAEKPATDFVVDSDNQLGGFYSTVRTRFHERTHAHTCNDSRIDCMRSLGLRCFDLL